MDEKKRNYRKYDTEFKKSAVSQIENGRSVQDVSIGLGVGAGLLYKWKEQFGNAQGQGVSSPDTKQLEKRIKELEKDNEILKKALAILAQKN